MKSGLLQALQAAFLVWGGGGGALARSPPSAAGDSCSVLEDVIIITIIIAIIISSKSQFGQTDCLCNEQKTRPLDVLLLLLG